jgi:hypothetical protein
VRRGVQVNWLNYAASTGFDACTLLDLGQNALNGTLPTDTGAINSNGNLGLSLYDNALSGSVPASYASLSWMALAYNPLLVGDLPVGVNTSKLQAWSSYYNRFAPWSSDNVRSALGLAPFYSTGYLYGTSIGLPRPLANILMDIAAGLDPNATVLRSWNASQLQPCRPWVTNNGAYPGQRTSSPGYGAAWTYISTATTATSADYCQDVGSYPYISATPAVTTRNAALAGGISALWLKALGLNGSLPCALGELKTVTSISLASNVLRGFLPPTLANLTALSAINLQLNRLQGSMPAAYGACKSAICRVRGPRALTASAEDWDPAQMAGIPRGTIVH